jgi:hypothetical protein
MKNRTSTSTDAIVQRGLARVRSAIKKGNTGRVDEYGRTMLSHAASSGDEKAIALLLEAGAQLDHADRAGFTPLHFAVDGGHLHVAKSLLAAGAAVDQADGNGGTPLQRAVYWGGRDGTALVELLLAHGANPKSKNKFGVSILEVAETDEEVLPLLLAANGRRKSSPRSKQKKPPSVNSTEKVDQGTLKRRAKLKHFEVCKEIWAKLVPERGQARSVQGELLRAVEKLRDEALRNGNWNWNKNHRRLVYFLKKTLPSFDVFSKTELAEIQGDLARIGLRDPPASDDAPFDRLSNRIGQLYEAHPKPIRRERDPKLEI